MNRAEQVLWVLCKTAIFTVLAPYTVGALLPQSIQRAFGSADEALYRPLWSSLASPVFLLLGVVIYLWCAWEFAIKGLGTPAPIDAPQNLVINGLYRYVRNPMYLGVLCLIFSRALYFSSFWILLYLLLVATCFHLFVITYEEPHLQQVFGDQYKDYCQNAPRWIPQLRAYRPPPI